MVRYVFLSVILFLFNLEHSFSLEAGFDFDSLTSFPDYKVVMKKVGQGSSTLLKNELNGEIVIDDAGSSANTPFNLEERIGEELGIATVSSDLPSFIGRITLITSHTDEDHIDYLYKVFGKNARLFRKLSQVLLGDHLSNYYKSSEAKTFLRTVVRNLKDPTVQAISLSHDTPITPAIIDAEAENDALYPSATYRGYQENYPIDGFLDVSQQSPHHFLSILSMNAGANTKKLKDENTNSCIVRLCLNGQNILIMGDATGLTTRRILLTPANHEEGKLETSLLVASHHGAKDHETNNGLWLSIIKPKRVAISAGYRDVWFHPRAEVIMDMMIVDSLTDRKCDISLEKDNHFFTLSGDRESTKFYVDYLSQYMTYKGNHPKESNWLVFETDKSIYNTAWSGDLTYVYDNLGQLVDFHREN